MTIEDAVVQIISDLPDGYIFDGPWLTKRVRELRGGKAMDGSVLKLLRVAKHSIPAKLNYVVVDRGKSLYRKLPVCSAPAVIRYQEEKDGQLSMRI